MSKTTEFERYLGLFRLRLKQLVLARGLAVLTVTALSITVFAVFLAVRQGFPDSLVIASRLILVAALAALGYRYLIRPGREIDADGSVEIEARAPGFGGQIGRAHV